MNYREFVYASIPGLEKDLLEAKGALARSIELDVEFIKWAEQFPLLPKDVLIELYRCE